MKYSSITLCGIFLLTNFVYAEENTFIPQKREEIQQKIAEKKIELQFQIELKREEIQQKIESLPKEDKRTLQFFAKERVSKAISHIFEQFEAVIVKFDGIVFRIENRIIKLEKEGVNVEKPKEMLVASKIKVQESATLVAATKIELQALILGEVSKDQIKTSIELCKKSLEDTKQSLIEVVESLKILGDISSDTLFIEE